MLKFFNVLVRLAFVVFLGWLAVAGFHYWWAGGNSQSGNVFFSESQNKPEETAGVKPTKSKPDQINTLPKSVNLDVPFTSQAPEGNWGSPFDHSCEEASVLMIHYFLADKKFDDPKQTSKNLKAINKFEEEKYGVYKDTTAEETARFARDYYKYKAKVSYNISADDIKKELAKGNPVIIPAAGRKLLNPYFTGDGPLYHALVIKGYDSAGFITNDPGTRRGADYKYSYNVIENAMHDWNGGDVENGKSAIIVITK